MKTKLVFLLSSVLFITAELFGQFHVGLRFGGNLNRVSVPDLVDILAPDIRLMPGINAGIVTSFDFGDHFSLNTELNYNEKGFKMSETIDMEILNINVPLGIRLDAKVRYIDLPILFQYRFGSGNVKPFIAAGPQVSYALNGEIRSRADFLVDLNLVDIPINFDATNYRRFDIGGTVMAGVEIETGQGRVFFDARYTQGFNDSFKLPVVDLHIRNYGFGAGIGYKMAF